MTAVVTGAASGMGRILAARLARKGATVHALDRDAAALDALAREGPSIVPHAIDVTDAAALDLLLRPLAASVDLVVTAAGIGHTGRIAETDPATFARLMSVNYLGTIATIAPLLPSMIDRRRGRIVLFASLAGWVPAPAHGPYNATKAALVMYAEVLRSELAGSGVRVTCVCPPAVATPLLDAMPHTKPGFRFVAPMSPEKVVDAVERAIERDRFWVFPDAASKALWRLRRFMPRLLGTAVDRMLR
jgi:short-subunit dehydrogenase